MEKRPITFECSDCTNAFTNLIDTADEPTIIVRCPYCNTESAADFSPYPKESAVAVMRNVRPRHLIPTASGWPEVIPTTPKSKPDAKTKQKAP